MCSLIPPDDLGDTADFRRGYAMAGAIMAIIFSLELIASAWLSQAP